MSEQQDDKTRKVNILSAGTEVGHYTIVERIGAGGMGEVYLAEDTKLQRRVALKFLPLQLAEDEEFKSRFVREARAAAKLNHPSIITIHEVGDFQGRPYFAMEHVDGVALGAYGKEQQLTAKEAISLFEQLASGLAHAHSSGIVHRDIKSANIIVDNDRRPKILDFGLASSLDDDRLTKAGSTVGTIAYMAPEQVQGKPVDARSDLFSLGIVFYEVLTGNSPFRRSNEAATLNAILSDEPPPLTESRPDVPNDLARIIFRLLQKDPDLRYQSASDLNSDLKLLNISGSAPMVSTIGHVTAKRSSTLKSWLPYLVIATIAVVAMVFWPRGSSGPSASGTQGIVVLPFENLGSEEDQYFADGITEEITARLARIGDLRVISRTSANQYRHHNKSLAQIGDELNVEYVLEGTIRWDKSGEVKRVRIVPQLIRVADDSHLWAQTYERTLDQIFAVQADIAMEIAGALELTFAGTGTQSDAAKQTENERAYDFYLRGSDYLEQAKYEIAIEMLEQAVALDAEFGDAWAKLSRAESRYAFTRPDNFRAEHVESARKAAEKALALDPNSPEAHIASGNLHYYGHRNYEAALEEFEIALTGKPNDADILSLKAFVKRRQGKWDEALALLEEASRIDPLSWSLSAELISTLRMMRMPKRALAEAGRALELSPDNDRLHLELGKVYLGFEPPERAAELLEEMSKETASWVINDLSVQLNFLSHDWDALRKLRLGRDISAIEDPLRRGQVYFGVGEFYYCAGMIDSAKAYMDSALAIIRPMAEEFRGTPEATADLILMTAAGLAVNDSAAAIRLVERAKAMLPASYDAIRWAEHNRLVAATYVAANMYDEAIQVLDTLMAVPTSLTVIELEHHCYWSALQSLPRFQNLIARYRKPAQS